MMRSRLAAMLLGAMLLTACSARTAKPPSVPAPAPAPAPATADEWNDRCYALGQERRWAESAEACRQAIALDKQHAYALYNLGWAEYKLGQYLPARTHIGASEALQNYTRWETRYALGLVAEALEEKSRAAVDFEAAAGRAHGESDEPSRALDRVKEFLPLPLPAPDGWTAYTNGRFGFRIFVPADWKPGPEPQNGDGRLWKSPDGKAEIRAWGSLDSLDKPVDHPDDRAFLYGFRWTEAARDGRSRVAWYRALRTEEQGSIEYGVIVSAPPEQWQQLQPLIETVMRSFRITFGDAYFDY